MSAFWAFHPLLRHIGLNIKSLKLYPNRSHLSFFKYASSTVEEEKVEVAAPEKIQLKKPSIKKLQRPPFAKNLFLGILNTDLLAFPEILDKEHLYELEQYVRKINNLFKEKVDATKSDEEKISEAFIQDLKDMGIFGRLVPIEYGGLGLSLTEYTRLNEVIGLDWSLAARLGAHELLGTMPILLAGTEEQKAKYLPDLAAGNIIAASCVYESLSGHDLTKPEADLKWLPDKKCYSLSGTKEWVTNGQIADLFIVFGKIFQELEQDKKLATFIVDRHSKGVEIVPLNDKTGLKGSKAAAVHFHDVLVPEENILGNAENGLPIVTKALEICRFGMSSVTLGVLKSVLDHVTDYCINTDRHEKPLADSELVKETLAHVARRLYAMESVSYYTAAIIDSTEDADGSIESFICKMFNSEGTLFCLRELMKLCGCLSLSNSHFLERLYRDALALESFDGPNDILKLFVGLVGCQYAGAKRSELIRQSRNPFFFPTLRVKQMLWISRITKGKIKYTQDIGGHLHPSLVPQANRLEECVQRLDVIVLSLLMANGQDIVTNQYEPVRLASMLIDIYVSTAVLSRSSRSYCIGLRNADQEIKMAYGICNELYNKIVNTYRDLLLSDIIVCDNYFVETGSKVAELKGYFPEHPLKHNF